MIVRYRSQGNNFFPAYCIILALIACACLCCLSHSAWALPPGSPAEVPFEYPKCTEQMRQYFYLKFGTMICAPIVCSAVLLYFLQSGMVAKLRNALSRSRSYVLNLACVATVIYMLARLLQFPFNFYSSYWLEHNFSLSNQSFPSWLKDDVQSIFVGAIMVPLIVAVFSIIRKMQRGWFLPVWILISVCMVGITFLEPIAVEPMFNKFRKLPESNLKHGIEYLCHQSGIAQPVILVADKSKQTKKLNAYVSGFSATKRIVLFDNLVKDVPEPQILAVVAHELGHYRLKHVITGLAIGIILLLPSLYFAEQLLNRLLSILPPVWGIKTKTDPAMVAVLCIISWLLPLIIAPIPSSISRLLESEADIYAIRLTHNPLAVARAFRTLSKQNLGDPDPPALIEFWFFSHPSIKHRIDSALGSEQGTIH